MNDPSAGGAEGHVLERSVFLLEFITLTLGVWIVFRGCTNKFSRCKQDTEAILRSLDWLQPLKTSIKSTVRRTYTRFQCGSRMQYGMDARV